MMASAHVVAGGASHIGGVVPRGGSAPGGRAAFGEWAFHVAC